MDPVNSINLDFDFQPKESLEDYVDENYVLVDKKFAPSGSIYIYEAGYINNNIFRKLSSYKKWKELFEPLQFFSLLYSQMRIILKEEGETSKHSEKQFSSSIICHLKGLELEKVQLGFLMYAIKFMVNQIIKPIDIKELAIERNLKSRPLQVLYIYLILEYDKMLKEFSPEILPENFDPPKNTLESKQIALIYVLNGENITPENCSEIAAGYFRCEKTSGHELYTDYISFIKTKDRIRYPGSIRALRNKIRLYKSILRYIDPKNKSVALFELKSLETLHQSFEKKVK